MAADRRNTNGAPSAILEGDDVETTIRTYQAGLTIRKEEPRPTAEGRKAQRQAIAAGDKAGVRLIDSMGKLTRTIVRELAEHRYGAKWAAIHLEDLNAEANLTVLKAAAEFDSARGPKFHTYAAMHVRNKIRSIVTDETGSSVKVPASWSRMRRRAVLERKDMAEQLGRNPSTSELRERLLTVCMQWSFEHLTQRQQELPLLDRTELAIQKLRKQGMLSALDHLDEVLLSGSEPVRLDAPLSNSSGETRTQAESITQADPERGVDETALQADMLSAIRNSLKELTTREQQIICLRYGIHGTEPWSFTEIGQQFNLSAERVRQIEDEARRKLRQSPNSSRMLAAHLYPEAAA